jgi:alkyldihydroxyacetonephosphate synthase
VRREQVFWGWGEPGAGPSLPEHAVGFLREELGVSGDVVDRPVALDDVWLRDPALGASLLRRLEAITGDVRTDRQARVLRCRGKSYLDLLAQRAGACEDAPDAVVAPADHDQVLAVLQVCAEEGVAVVPFGGGTSVVGGVEPLRGPFAALISLDLARMDQVAIDARSRIATLGPGLRLPEADRALGAHGLRLAHLPQSYEWATVGGCVATRSAGQASTGRGRIDENLIAVRVATPLGDLATREAPASAAGPELRQLVAGSEGVLGVITAATLRVHPVGEERFEGWLLPDFEAGCEALRRLEQAGLAPDVARLSDEDETRYTLALAGLPRIVRRLADGRCLLIVSSGRRDASRIIRAAGGAFRSRKPGERWAHSRFDGPHLRDDLLDRGVMVETLETATTWSNLSALREAVRGALPGLLVGCHVSHLYPAGASLYFTVLGRQSDDPPAQWRALKAAATDAIVAAGGTITHHHAVGRDHAPWMGAEVGELGLGVLRALKERCDPAGIMNPGKLAPSARVS